MENIWYSFDMSKENKKRKIQIGVMGSAADLKYSKDVESTAYEAGKFVAESGNILGTGLGLYVAKEMIKAHGGRVWVESEGQGKGSTFFVELAVV